MTETVSSSTGFALRHAPPEIQQRVQAVLAHWPSNRGQSTPAFVQALHHAIAQIVVAWGGQWLDPDVRPLRRVRLQCAQGHVWQIRPSFLYRGQWCPTCYFAGLRAGIPAMQQLAAKHGGLCLSDNYTNDFTKLQWQCAYGHNWDATPGNIKAGNWCAACNQLERQVMRLAEMHELARARGGLCLSTEYINSSSKLTWQCAEGHIWHTKPSIIKSAGAWCPVCRYAKRKLDLPAMQALAHERGGECLSTEYVSSNHKLRWQCAHGHIWETTPSHIQTGSWCMVCLHQKLRLTLADMQFLAQTRGGQCLSTEYINSNSKLTWQCTHGHSWSATPAHIKNGTWCPHCEPQSRRYTLADMQALAHERGGLCLSTTYVSRKRKLQWQCSLGHVWDATPGTILGGCWCPQCHFLSLCRHDKARRKYLPVK